MMSYCSKSKDSVKKYAEVFTPPGVVFQMILAPEFIELLKNLNQTFFDPCVGEGQFPCAELVLKMFYNVDNLNADNALAALSSLHGMDIQAKSVNKCRAHMLVTFCDAYKFFTDTDFSPSTLDKAIPIILQNFNAGDSLEFMKDLAAFQKKSERLFLLE